MEVQGSEIVPVLSQNSKIVGGIFLSAWQKETQNLSRGFGCFQPRCRRSPKSEVPLKISSVQFIITEPSKLSKQILHDETSVETTNSKTITSRSFR